MILNILNKTIYSGILVIIFLLPSYLVRFEILSIPTTLLEVLIYIIFLLWVVFLFFDKEKAFLNRLKNLFFQNKLLFFGVFLLFFGAFVASVSSVDLRVSFGLFKAYFIDPLLFLVVLVSVISEKGIKRVVAIFLASGVGISLLSTGYFLSGELTYDGRLEGFFNSPNFLAMSLSPIILFLIWILFSRYKYNISKLVWFSALILVMVPFLLTYSYGAFFSVFIASIFIVGLSQSTIKIKFFALLVLLLVSFSLFFSQINNEKTRSFLLGNNRSSLASRSMIWSASYQILKDNYIFGIGPGMFQEYYLTYQNKFKEPYLEWAVPYPHNIFLAFWIQVGILGFLGFLLILIWVFKTCVKSLLETGLSREYERDVVILALSFFVYFIIHGLLDTPFWKNDLSLTFFLFVGLLLLIGDKRAKKV